MMIYPVKLEFKIYPSGAWEDWSMYLSEPPSISRKVESENAGEAGLIVFDNASVSLYYDEGNPVHAAFKEENLYSAQRYMFRISLPKSDRTYEQVFEGMADFSTIEWPDESRLISFDIVDKLSALAILPEAPYRIKQNLTARIRDRYPEALAMYFWNNGGEAALIECSLQLWGKDIGVTDALDLYAPIVHAGEFISVFGEGEKEELMLVVSSTVSGKFNDLLLVNHDKLAGKSWHLPDNPVLYFTDSEFGNIDINIYNSEGKVIGFDGIKIAESIIKMQWPDIEILTRPGGFNQFVVPVTYDSQLQVYNPFNKSGLEALKMLADSMFCYIYFNRDGKLVLQKKDSLGDNGTTRTKGGTRVKDAVKKYFWDKLVDGVTVKAQGWIYENNELVTGEGTLVKTLPGSDDYIEPENEITKEVFAETTEQTTTAHLNDYALSVASKYLNFYGLRHTSWEYELALDDNTIMWDLLDNIVLQERFFFAKIDYDLDSRTVSLELVSVAGYDYDPRQIRKTKSETSYNSTSSGTTSKNLSGGGSSNYGRWDGGPIGLNPALGRQSLGLQNITNIGSGDVSTEEFNSLNGVTSNIQEQLNAKERILSFTDPLVRSGDQISLFTGSLRLGNNSEGFSLSGAGKLVGSDLSISFPQRLDQSGTPQFARIGIGGSADFSYLLKVYGSEYITGAFRADGNARIARLGLGTDADSSLSLKTAAGVLINGDLTIVGNIYQSGTAYLVDAQHLQVESNIIYVNKNEQGGGVTNGIAGIEVERGTGTNYQFVFSESDDTFRLGMPGSLQAAATRQDSPISQAIAYWNNTAFRFDTSVNLKFDGTHLGLGGASLTEALNVAGNIMQTGYNGLYNSFVSGYLGAGWKLWKDASASYLEIDNIVVRNSFRTHIFQKELVRVSNGYLLISDSAKIVAETSSGAGYLYADDGTLRNGDLVWYKDVENDGSVITGIKITLTSDAVDVPQLPNSAKSGYKYTFAVYSGSGTFRAGGTIARVGGSLPGRQGSMYFDASSGGAPFFDVYDGVTTWAEFASVSKIKTRIGKLDGITDADFGTLSGYGIYSNRAFLTEDVLIGGRSLGLMQGITALFHFDDNLYDCVSGIKPSYTGTLDEKDYGLIKSSDNSLVCTKVTGKFGGGVAVEEGTANLITNGACNDLPRLNNSYSVSQLTASIDNGQLKLTTSAAAAGTRYYSIGAFPSGLNGVTPGQTYAASLTLTDADAGIALSNLSCRIYEQYGGTWYSTSASFSQIGQRLVVTRTLNSAATGFAVIIQLNQDIQNAVLKFDNIQLEQKTYGTSFVEGTRPAGKLLYNFPLNNKFSISMPVFIDYNRFQNGGFIFELTKDGNNRIYLDKLSSTSSLQLAVILDGTTRVNKYTYSLNTITAGWHTITLTYDGSKYCLYIDGFNIYSEPSVYGPSGNWTLFLGSAYNYSAASYSNCYYDELAFFNRDLSENEIKNIHYSNQPLQESPGMTYISGNRVRTGYISGENYVSNAYGMMIDLNKSILEMNFGGANIFKFDASTSSAKIAAFNFNDKKFFSTALGINIGDYTGYTPAANTTWIGGRTVGDTTYRELYMYGANSGNYIRLFTESQFGRIQGAWKKDANNGVYIGDLEQDTIDTGFGFLIKSNGLKVFKSTIAENYISGWAFNAVALTDRINGIVRLEASASLAGLAVTSGGSDVLKVGYFTNASESYSTTAVALPNWTTDTAMAGVIMNASGDPCIINNANVTLLHISGYSYSQIIYKSINVSTVAGKTLEWSIDIREIENQNGGDVLYVLAYIRVQLSGGYYYSKLDPKVITPAVIDVLGGTPHWESKTLRANIPSGVSEVKVFLEIYRRQEASFAPADVEIRNMSLKYYSKSFIELNQNGLKFFNSPINKIEFNNTTSAVYAPELRTSVLSMGPFTLMTTADINGNNIYHTLAILYNGNMIARMLSSTGKWMASDGSTY